MAGFNVKRFHFVATDMISCLLEECIDNMDEDTFSDYMDFHFKICERRDMTAPYLQPEILIQKKIRLKLPL